MEFKQKIFHQHTRILILGPADAGKSTILSQLSLNFGDGYPVGDVPKYRLVIFNTVILIFKLLINERGPTEDVIYEEHTKIVMEYDEMNDDDQMSEIVYRSILSIWNDNETSKIAWRVMPANASLNRPDIFWSIYQGYSRLINLSTSEGTIS